MHRIRDYATVTASYWVFTLTDGALRMLVLLFLHEQGYSPLSIASLFLFYELFGVVTNFVGGWLGARFGLKSTLFAGLGLQIVACGMLTAEVAALTLPYLLVAQGLSGVAKDLTKMSSKSYIKLVVPESDSRGLMKWVALLTGSKNTLKGVGFFLGGVLLSAFGLQTSCLGMAGALALALVLSVLLLPKAPGKSDSKLSLGNLIPRDARINWLSAARLFLFGSRDVWFVLALPIFLTSTLGWEHQSVGAFLALWIIGYGFVQALAPSFVGARRESGGRSVADAGTLARWTALLVLPLTAIAGALFAQLPAASTLIIGLAVFGVVFAANSAIHSYLILAYAEGDRVALRVGFYYMSNAMGRLIGTLLSGLVFQVAGQGQVGLVACLGVSILFVVLSAVLCGPLRRAERHHAGAAAG